MMAGLGIDSEWGRILALLTIGSGSMLFSHANDSYFWVISKFADISSKATLVVYSSATVVVSIVAFAVTWIVSFFIL
jgi:GntP family gluconate:H+ symporter